MTETATPTHQDPTIASMVQLVMSIARSLVDAPDEISVEALEEGDGVLLRLTIPAGDVGKLLGRQGRTARSLRTVLTAASIKAKQNYTLDIVELRQ